MFEINIKIADKYTRCSLGLFRKSKNGNKMNGLRILFSIKPSLKKYIVCTINTIEKQILNITKEILDS